MAHIEKIKFSRTVQVKPFHPIEIEATLHLNPDDDYETEKNKLVGKVNNQIDIELKRYALAESVYDLQCQKDLIQREINELRQQKQQLNQENCSPTTLNEEDEENDNF
jgi:hypothetical protein